MQLAMETSNRVRGGVLEENPALLEQIRRAMEAKDIDALAEVYAEGARLEEVSSLSPPAHPLVVEGREAILERFRNEILHDPISGWARNLESAQILDAVETDDVIAFTEVRTYAAGDKVVAQHFAHKRQGRIERDRIVVAFDAQ
jgi:ketosteroid isomerase-like protein